VGLLIWGRRWWLRGEIEALSGLYALTRKSAASREPDKVRVRVKGNVLRLMFEGLPGGDWITGEIVMNDLLRASGEGHYRHFKDGQHLWGLTRIYAPKGTHTIFEHRTYANEETFQEVVSGFLWTKIEG
jgi:hypothetical protein